MKRQIIISFVVVFVFLLAFNLNAKIYKLKLDGVIDSISEEYIKQGFAKIKDSNDADIVVIQIDTPGGLSTSMRSIIKEIMNFEKPVVGFVSPNGARAASAGFFILMSCDIAVMSNSTNTGAATPVSVLGGKMDETMKKKVINDAISYIKSISKSKNRNDKLTELAVKEGKSYTSETCIKEGLIDFIADSFDELIRKVNGKIVRKNNKEIKIDLTSSIVEEIDLSWRQKFLKTITNPNLAYFLLLLGIFGLYVEFTHPGFIVPGVLGGISLLLAFLSFQILPINYIGLLLIILSIGLFIAEIKVQGFGFLGIGGVIAFVLGSIILINSPIPEMRPAMSYIVILSLTFGILILFLTYKVYQALNRKKETGQEGLIGETGVAKTDIDENGGKVFVHGEWWNAFADEPISIGSTIIVEEINNLKLKVKKKGG